MFNILKNWWNKPWTNGTCIKWGLCGMLMSLIVIAAELIWFSGWTPSRRSNINPTVR